LTRQELIYDVKTILEPAGITDESRLDEDYIGFKIDQKRAKEIRDTFKRNPVIEPIWLQDIGIFDLATVNKAEDRSVSICNCKFSKAVIPPVVSITDNMSNAPDIGTYSVRSSCGTHEFYYQNISRLSLMHPDSKIGNMRYFAKVGNAIYLTPEVIKARAILILEKPLDGYVLDNAYQTVIANGTTYYVASGNVTYNSVIYYKGSTFVGTSTTSFTGSGKVQYNNQKRAMTNEDNYPMSQTMSEVVLMKIFQQDYGIERQQVADLKNDADDQTNVLKSGIAQ